MSDALSAMKAKAVSEPIKLEKTGTRVKLRLPGVKECVVAGGVPMEIVSKMTKLMEELTAARTAAEAAGTPFDAPEPEPDTREDWEADILYRREMVRQSLVEIEGDDGWEPVALTSEDVDALDVEDRAEIFKYACRAIPLPLRT